MARCSLNDKPYSCLLDSGSQANIITQNVMEDLGLELVREMPYKLRGTGNNSIQYLGITEINVKFPDIKAYDRVEPFLVLPKDDRPSALHVQIGTNVIDLAIELMVESELHPLEEAWNRCKFSAITAALFNSQTIDSKSAQALNKTFEIKTRESHTIPAQSHIVINARSNSKWVGLNMNVSVNPREICKGLKLLPSYATIKGGTGNINVIVNNENDHPIKLTAKQLLGSCQAANEIPEPTYDEKKIEHFSVVVKNKKKEATENNVNSNEENFEDALEDPHQETIFAKFTEILPLVQEDDIQTREVIFSNRCEVPPEYLPDCEDETLEEKPPPPKHPADMTEKERENYLLSKLDLSGIEDLDEATQQSVKDLILKYKDIFALTNTELGNSSSVKHKIQITDPIPFKERYRPIAPGKIDSVKQMLDDMLEVGAIEPSKSPWASGVVLAKKKDGTMRFCIDLRRLNDRTIKDAYSLPRIEDTLHLLKDQSWFSSLDLQSGYWQVELDEEAKEMTAFTVGPLGFYQCVRMPFGLSNAPATFQRLMETCLGELHLTCCLIYLDDIIIFSPDIPVQLQRMEAVFIKIREENLKLKPSKCDLFRRKLKYLGHLVSEKGVEMDPDKIKVVQEWGQLHTVTNVRSFLGFCNHYRRFIKDYAKIAKPINALISGDNASCKKTLVTHTLKSLCAIQVLKNKIAEDVMLAYPDFKKTFKLNTDASGYGLGAALYQFDDEGRERPVAFASRSVNAAEARYPAHKMEFLGMKWAITDQFKDYLAEREFNVFTDNNPLTYVLGKAKLDAIQQRWVAELANFLFSIHYKKGADNTDADALSRIMRSPESSQKVLRETIPSNVVQELLKEANDVKPLAPIFAGRALVDLMSVVEEDPLPLTKDWRKEQLEDPLLKTLIEALEKDELASLRVKPGTEPLMKSALRHKQQLTLRKGILYNHRRVPVGKHKYEYIYRLAVPSKFRKRALQALHDDLGHLGRDRCIDLMQDRLWWPKCQEDMDKHVKTCERCIRVKGQTSTSPLKNLTSTHPLHLVHVDYLTIKEGEADLKKNNNILIITDHFTRFAQAIVTQTQTAQTVANVLWQRFFSILGLPERLLTDQGTNFDCRLIKELCQLAGTKKIRTTAYHPQTNGQCERFNSTLLQMLRTLDPGEKAKWQKHVAALCHAYNCTKNTATGHSPYELLFGRKPRLPVDLLFDLEKQGQECSTADYVQYIQDLRDKMQHAFELAEKLDEKNKIRQQRKYNAQAKSSLLKPGDLVLMRKRDSSKISDKWSQEMFTIVEKPYKDQPLYMVKPMDSDRLKSVHRNNLFLLSSFEPDTEEDDTGEADQPPEPGDSETNGDCKDSTQEREPCSSNTPETMNPSGFVEIGEPGRFSKSLTKASDTDLDAVEQLNDVQVEGPVTRSRARETRPTLAPGIVEEIFARLAQLVTGGAWNNLQ